MTIRTIAELRTLMPVNTAQGISAQDINDFVDTVEEFTTQRVSAKTASYTAVTGDNRTFFTVNSSTATTFTVPSAAPAGWECAVMQLGTGQVTIAPGGTGVRRHPDLHTRTAKQYAVVYIKVFSNAGTAPNFAFTGDTGD
jgi:hypothetical protein